ncbi:MAG: glycine cleavage system protein T [Gammaproteobacteria bacterium]|nr:glycine cleavage system protein T [Gammaproteobacteria bacterium]
MQTHSSPLIGFGSRVRPSAYFDATRRYGCKAYSVYNHMYMPLYYESPEADYWRLVNDVTLWDVGVERQVEITGPDAARFTQYLTPRNLSKCVVGQCKYVFITSEQGGIINDPVLLRLDDNHFWLSLADSDVLLWAKGVAVHSGMDVQIEEPDVHPLQLQGPQAPRVIQALLGDEIAALRYFWFRELDLDGIPIVVSRTGWSGERGYEIYLRDSQYGDRLWERIMEAGKQFNIAPAGTSAIRRIEAGMLSYGTDITIENNPFELGMERLVDLEQEADFIGKEALTEIKTRGPHRKLVGMQLDGEPLEAPNLRHWPVKNKDHRVGHVSSCVYSPGLQRNIGLAMVVVEFAALGSTFTVDAIDGVRSAEIVPLPFAQPKQTS